MVEPCRAGLCPGVGATGEYMRMSGRGIRLGLIALAALPALSGCGGIAHLDCSEIAQRAVRKSQDRPIKLASITNVRETARTESEARCAGDATLADGGTAPLYLRAREVNGQVDVDYQGVPYP
jgi:hypothetical protein